MGSSRSAPPRTSASSSRTKASSVSSSPAPPRPKIVPPASDASRAARPGALPRALRSSAHRHRPAGDGLGAVELWKIEGLHALEHAARQGALGLPVDLDGADLAVAAN